MSDTWFTADFHFGHQKITRTCDRRLGEGVEQVSGVSG
jgi:calcineurin-like phosphoesterase family protein